MLMARSRIGAFVGHRLTVSTTEPALGERLLLRQADQDGVDCRVRHARDLTGWWLVAALDLSGTTTPAPSSVTWAPSYRFSTSLHQETPPPAAPVVTTKARTGYGPPATAPDRRPLQPVARQCPQSRTRTGQEIASERDPEDVHQRTVNVRSGVVGVPRSFLSALFVLVLGPGVIVRVTAITSIIELSLRHIWRTVAVWWNAVGAHRRYRRLLGGQDPIPQAGNLGAAGQLESGDGQDNFQLGQRRLWRGRLRRP